MGYHRLFSSITPIDPPRGLYDKIVMRIELAERRMMRARFALFGTTSVVSCGLMFFAFKFAIQEFVRSGFYQYSSLLLSDGGSVIRYWKEFSFLLIESLPVFGIVVFLSSIFALLLFLRYATRKMRMVYYQPRLTA